jgi:peptidoglycan DL-endopeptidase CwlO
MDQVTFLDQISKNQSRDIATFTEAKKGFDAEKKRLDELLAAQNAQKTELETKKTKIEGDLKALEALVAKLKARGGTTAKTNTGTTAKKPAVSGSAGKVVDFAFAQLGKPYKYGAVGPNAFDCSGLTMAAWKQAGFTLPHNAASQYSRTKRVAKADLVPGDLVFSNGLGHVGIYIGNGQIIHAPNSSRPVEVGSINFAGYYGAGRP